MNDKPIDVHYEDVNKKYYTIDEVSDVLKIEQSKIIFYFEKLNDFLNITSVGMYQLFDNTDIRNLQIIRDLEINSCMTIKDIKDYLILNKQEILLQKESNNMLDKSILNIFQTFANALIEQNTKMDTMYKNNTLLVESVNNLAKNQEEIGKYLQEQKELTKEQVREYSAVNKTMSEKLQNIQQELAITKDTNKKLEEELSQKLESQSQQIQTNFNDMSEKIISENTKVINEIKEFKYIKLESEQEPKGFLDNIAKLFHKKK